MSNAKYYIQIKDKQIPVIIRSFKNSNVFKLYFKDNVLNISKPKFMKQSELKKQIKLNEDLIYSTYNEMLKNNGNENVSKDNKSWYKHYTTNEKFFFLGEEFTIVRELIDSNYFNMSLDKENKQIIFNVPKDITDEEDIKSVGDKLVKQILKDETINYLNTRLPELEKTTNIKVNSCKVQDAKTRFGSCVASKKALHFTSRIIMLPANVIDAIIIHELCHISHPNHSKAFYDLVISHKSDYKEIDKWLKKNSNMILF